VATVHLSGGGSSFDSLAQAQRARLQSAAEIERMAREDWAAVYEIIRPGYSPEGLAAVEDFLARYEDATVDVAGRSHEVEVPEVELAQQLRRAWVDDQDGYSEYYYYGDGLDTKNYRNPRRYRRGSLRAQGGWLTVGSFAGIGMSGAAEGPAVPLGLDVNFQLSFDGWSAPGVSLELSGATSAAHQPLQLFGNVHYSVFKHDIGLAADLLVGASPRISETGGPALHEGVGVRKFIYKRETGAFVGFRLEHQVLFLDAGTEHGLQAKLTLGFGIMGM
jgi:hypothetical protein